MEELLSKFEPGHLIGLVSVIGGFACGIVAIVMGVGLEIRRVELAADLKKDMLERGMTAEEIRIVMEAGTNKAQDLCKPDRGGSITEPVTGRARSFAIRPNWLSLPLGEGWGEGPTIRGWPISQQKREENSSAARARFHHSSLALPGPRRP